MSSVAMANSNTAVLPKIIRGCSRLLLWVGAAVFLFGGKFLYEIRHVSFLASEVVGIIGGVLLMLLGAGIGYVAKPSSPEQNLD